MFELFPNTLSRRKEVRWVEDDDEDFNDGFNEVEGWYEADDEGEQPRAQAGGV